VRRRPAVVDVDGAAVEQREVEVVVAAERVAPGQPVHEHRRLDGEKRPDGLEHGLVCALHAVGVDHALGRGGRSGREQQLCDRAGADPRDGLLECWRGGGFEEFVEAQRPGTVVAGDQGVRVE
jgi:hypothetical protein